MRLTILRKKSYYALGLALAILGVVMLLIVVWRWWVTDVFSSSDMISAITSSFGNEDAVLGFGLGLTILPYFIVGIICLVVGSVVLVLRREKVTVTEEVTTLLGCPLCKHRWKERFSKSQLKSMGFPQNRTISRRKCRACGRFNRPKIRSL